MALTFGKLEMSGQASNSASGSRLCSMKANAEVMMKIAQAFRAGIIANLKEQAGKQGGTLAVSVDILLAAAFPAFAEACESEFDSEGKPFELSPAQCAVIWEGVLKVNGSAFLQGLQREAKAGTLGFALAEGASRAKGIALRYTAAE